MWARGVPVVVLAVVVLAAPGQAQSDVWTIDPDHSALGFSVRHMMVSNVRGQFRDVSGTVVVQGDDPSTAVIEVRIDPASIDTGQARRDTHLRSGDFFDVAAHPEMAFVSRRVEQGADGIRVVGDLTMRGVTREVVLELGEVTPPVKDTAGHLRRGVSARGTVDRTTFGLVWNKLLEGGGVVVGDEVEVEIDVELVAKASSRSES